MKFCEKGDNGVHPPRQYHYKSKEEELMQAKKGKTINLCIKWLDKNKFKVFNNINSRMEAQEFDSIVIGDKAVFNVKLKIILRFSHR